MAKRTKSGKLPEGWEVKRLGEIFEIEDQRIEPRQTPEEYFAVYSIPAFDKAQQPEILKGSEIGSQKFKIRPPVILISRLNPRIQRVWFVEKTPLSNAVASTEFVLLKPLPVIDKKFAYYLCTSSVVQKHLRQIAEGTTGSRQRVSPRELPKIEVFVPCSKDEQRRIAALLGLVDEVAERTRRIVEGYQKLKKALLHRLLTKGIGHTRFKKTPLGELPEKWEVKRLEEVCQIVNGYRFPREFQGRRGLTYPFIKVSDMLRPGNEKYIFEAENTVNDEILKALKAKVFPPKTVIFPKVGAACSEPHFLDTPLIGVYT